MNKIRKNVVLDEILISRWWSLDLRKFYAWPYKIYLITKVFHLSKLVYWFFWSFNLYHQHLIFWVCGSLSSILFICSFIGNEPWCSNGINEKEIECCDWKMVSSFENKLVCFAWVLVFAICWRSLFSHNIQYQLHYGVKSHFLFQQLIKICA